MRTVYYINDLGLTNGLQSQFDMQRLPQAHINLYPWYCVRWESIDSEIRGTDNIIIVQTPVGQEEHKLRKALELSKQNFVFVSQEGNIFDWFEWTAVEQELYIKLLSNAKAFLYHSEFDKKLMSVFIDKFVRWHGCINYVDSPKTFENSGEYISLPVPIKRYQRGMITHKLAVDCIKDIPIYASSYTKPAGNHQLSFPDSYKLGGINLIPRLKYIDWMTYINNSKFGIDIHREFSGGNCSIEYASLGVPLIGNINLDSQRELFPQLSFDYMDYPSIKNAIHLLLNDKDFYNEVSIKAIEGVKTNYLSGVVVEKFRIEFDNLLTEILK